MTRLSAFGLNRQACMFQNLKDIQPRSGLLHFQQMESTLLLNLIMLSKSGGHRQVGLNFLSKEVGWSPSQPPPPTGSVGFHQSTEVKLHCINTHGSWL